MSRRGDALIFPIFFVPFLDNRVEGYAEAFMIDTRNGYLYGHVTEEDKRGKEFATIYEEGAKAIADQQWVDLRQKLRKELVKLMESERAQAKKAAGAPAPAKVEEPAAGQGK